MLARSKHGHFKWCPAYSTEKVCLCQLGIYISMAIIGFGGALSEYVIGDFAGATAPKADALHLGSDTASDIVVAIIVAIVASNPSDEKRVRKIGAYIQVALLVLATALIGYEIYQKIIAPQLIVPYIMMIAGFIGLVSNAARFSILNLKKGGWDVNRLIQNKHVRIDLYYSIAVVGASTIILFFGWEWVDIATSVGILIFASKMTLEAWAHARSGYTHDH